MENSMKLILMLVAVLTFSTTAMAQNKSEPWVIPAKYKAMKSAIKANDPSVMTVGKELYNKHCKSCHGTKGYGDGPKSASMKTEIRPLNDKAFLAQTDGEIYYQSFVGRDEMPNFEKKILDEEDRWAVVQFMRTLK